MSCRAVGKKGCREEKSIHQFYHNLSAALGLVGAALRAGRVAGNGCAAFRALAEDRRFPSLCCQAGALLHLGCSAFWCCHNSDSGLRLFGLSFAVLEWVRSRLLQESLSRASQTLLPLGVAQSTPGCGFLSSLKSPIMSFNLHSCPESSHFG